MGVRNKSFGDVVEAYIRNTHGVIFTVTSVVKATGASVSCAHNTLKRLAHIGVLEQTRLKSRTTLVYYHLPDLRK